MCITLVIHQESCFNNVPKIHKTLQVKANKEKFFHNTRILILVHICYDFYDVEVSNNFHFIIVDIITFMVTQPYKNINFNYTKLKEILILLSKWNKSARKMLEEAPLVRSCWFQLPDLPSYLSEPGKKLLSLAPNNLHHLWQSIQVHDTFILF